MGYEAKEIGERIARIHTALAVNIGGQPKIEPFLTVHASGNAAIYLYGTQDYSSIYVATGETISECLADAEAYVASMPDADTRLRGEWHGKLGDLIHDARTLDIPDEVLEPIKEGHRAMPRNLLPAPATAAE